MTWGNLLYGMRQERCPTVHRWMAEHPLGPWKPTGRAPEHVASWLARTWGRQSLTAVILGAR